MGFSFIHWLINFRYYYVMAGILLMSNIELRKIEGDGS